MLKGTRILYVFLILGSLLCAEGKAELTESFSPMAIIGDDSESVTFREHDGTLSILPKKPQNVVVCLNSLLDLWYMSGGEAIARVKGSENVPPEATDLPLLGSFSQLNREKIMELEPDFIIFSESQKKERDFFAAEGIPTVCINYVNYDDFRVILDLFTRVTGERGIYEKELVKIQEQVQSLIDQVPLGEGPSYCILFASTRNVKAETDNTVTGYNLKLLGGRNIYKENLIEGAVRVDLSLEYIVEQDPDIIFVTTMGSVDKSLDRIQDDMASSPVWSELNAIKQNRYYVLDKSYSIYKPNRFYPEAFEIEAEYLYPQIDFVIPSAERE
jgi:iron complex transport system substrate-binding protein